MSNLDFNRTFGGLNSPAAAAGSTGAGNRKPDAKTWLNVGYVVTVEEIVDGKPASVDKFVSLPGGIALDTMDPAQRRGNNADFNAFIDAKNNFMRQMQEAAAALAPGEDRIIAMSETGLCIQLRHVAEKSVETPVDQNRYAVKLPF